MRSLLLTLIALAVAVLPATAASRPRAAPRILPFCSVGADVPGVTVPEGFCIRKFVDVNTPRVLAFAPNGDLFVSSPGEPTPGGAPGGDAAIYVFRQTDRTRPPTRSTYASNLETVHGLAFGAGTLLYSLRDAAIAVPYVTGDLSIRSGERRIVDMSDAAIFPSRWTHTIAVGTDGSIYVSRGQFDNLACPDQKLRNGSILKTSSTEPNGHLVSSGFRDPLYIRCLPWGTCYAAELTGDTWEMFGGASEKLVEIHEGDNFGYPCCIGLNSPNPELEALLPPVRPDCSRVASALQTFPLHDTPFGFDWERHQGWPAAYDGAFFVGLHGQFSTWRNAGLQWAPVDPATHLPLGPTTPFLDGAGRARPISRIADVVFASDGRLFFTDDQGGAIYWIAPKTLAPH